MGLGQAIPDPTPDPRPTPERIAEIRERFSEWSAVRELLAEIDARAALDRPASAPALTAGQAFAFEDGVAPGEVHTTHIGAESKTPSSVPPGLLNAQTPPPTITADDLAAKRHDTPEALEGSADVLRLLLRAGGASLSEKQIVLIDRQLRLGALWNRQLAAALRRVEELKAGIENVLKYQSHSIYCSIKFPQLHCDCWQRALRRVLTPPPQPGAAAADARSEG